MGWNIWDLWELRGKKRSFEDDLTVSGKGEFVYELDFIPRFVEAKFVKHHEYPYSPPRPSCVPMGHDHLKIENYFRLVVIKWNIKDGGTRIIHWEVKQ